MVSGQNINEIADFCAIGLNKACDHLSTSVYWDACSVAFAVFLLCNTKKLSTLILHQSYRFSHVKLESVLIYAHMNTHKLGSSIFFVLMLALGSAVAYEKLRQLFIDLKEFLLPTCLGNGCRYNQAV